MLSSHFDKNQKTSLSSVRHMATGSKAHFYSLLQVDLVMSLGSDNDI